VSGCLSPFEVLLTSGKYWPTVAWPLCLQPFTIPAGETRYPVTVWATYSQCSQGRPHDGVIGCLPGGRMPPLPPGTYHARLFQAPQAGLGSAPDYGAGDTAGASLTYSPISNHATWPALRRRAREEAFVLH